MGRSTRSCIYHSEHYFLVSPMSLKGMLSIWFFVGGLLAIYGALILIEGVRGFTRQAEASFALADLHLQVWWGIGLLVLGCVYLVHFRPRRTK